MNQLRIRIPIVIICILLSAAAFAQSVRSGIETALLALTKAFNSGNAGGVAAHYTTDAALLPPDGARIDGKDAIQKFWQGAIDGKMTELVLDPVEVEPAGDFAFEVGTLTYKAPGKDGKPAPASGKYIVIWKRGSDGVWRLHRDIWNANPPVSAQ